MSHDNGSRSDLSGCAWLLLAAFVAAVTAAGALRRLGRVTFRIEPSDGAPGVGFWAGRAP